LAALGLYAGLPWLAPVFMKLGWEPPGRILYMAYSTQCHQLANRSYFLFGPEWMVPPDRLAAAGAETSMLGLRAFLGSSEIGWKVAWSDRMVAMYSSAFLFLLIAPISRRLRRPLSVGVFLLMTLPLALDGTTHFLSDLQGFGQGFRDSNAWLVTLTNGGLPASFYAGDAWGSFNATARLVTGILFGVGAAWTLVPRLLPDVELMIRSGAVGATPATRTEGGTTRTEPIHPTIVTPGPSARPAAVQHRVQGGTHGD
jgi:uncharacterized membrane protein